MTRGLIVQRHEARGVYHQGEAICEHHLHRQHREHATPVVRGHWVAARHRRSG